MGSTPGTQRSPLRNIYLLYATCSSSGEKNTKNISPLTEHPGLCNILLLEALESFLTKDEVKVASSTVQRSSLFPGVKTAALAHLHSLALLSGRLSCWLSYFECPVSSGTAAEQGLSHHDISTILRGKGTLSSCPLSVRIQHFLPSKTKLACSSQLKTSG